MAGLAAAGDPPLLAGIDLALAAGSLTALVGADPAAMAALAGILAGRVRPAAGTVRIDGRPVDAAQLSAAGLQVLSPAVTLMPDMSVAENIGLNAMPVRRRFGMRVVDRAALAAQAQALLDRLGFAAINAHAPVRGLSLLHQRVVELARAMAGLVGVLVLHEPSAGLAAAEATALAAAMDRLRKDGPALLVLTQHLDEAAAADRTLVLREGRIAASFERDTGPASLLEAMLAGPSRADAVAGDLLSVEALVVPDRLDLRNWSARAGEVLAIHGTPGSGVEVLGHALAAALAPIAAGRLKLGGRSFRPAPDAGAAERSLYVDADAPRPGTIRWLGDLRLDAIPGLGGPSRPQPACVARWAVERGCLLVVEDPGRGLDADGRARIAATLRACAERGDAVLVLTTAPGDAGLADRTLVLAEGRFAPR